MFETDDPLLSMALNPPRGNPEDEKAYFDQLNKLQAPVFARAEKATMEVAEKVYRVVVGKLPGGTGKKRRMRKKRRKFIEKWLDEQSFDGGGDEH